MRHGRVLLRCGVATALALMALGWTAPSAGRTNRRFHYLTSKLRSRLPAKMRSRVDAAGLYLSPHYTWRLKQKGHDPNGTACLVERSGNKGLVLTNAHVVEDNEGFIFDTSRVVGGQVAFRLGGPEAPAHAAKVTRLVLGARHLDFALLEVELPPQLQDLKPVPLSRRLPTSSSKLYNAAFPNLAKMTNARSATALNRSNRDLVQPSSATNGVKPRVDGHQGMLKMVQVGRVLNDGRVDQLRWNKHYLRPSMVADLPAFYGSSGSLVFDGSLMVDGKSHAAVGLLNQVKQFGRLARKGTGERGPAQAWTFQTRFIPIGPILDWIGDKLQQGSIPNDLRQRVSALVASAQ